MYKQIDSDLEIEFDHPNQNDGDLYALKEMVKESGEGDFIPIAVCDPVAMLSGGFGVPLKDLRVLGAFITRVPFWAIDGPHAKEVEDEVELRKFEKLIFYSDKLQTGNYIGRQTMAVTGIADIQSVEYGKEFRTLLSEKEQGKAIAITCDVLGMAIHKKQNKINVAHAYSRNKSYKNFITTALITTAEICDEHSDKLITVLQGMQNSLAILRSSKEIAISICRELATNQTLFQEHHRTDEGVIPELDAQQILDIVNWIYEGDFYPQTLDISREQWTTTIDCHSRVFGFDEMRETFDEGRKLYDTVVVNKYLLEAQKRFISTVGINFQAIVEKEFETQLAEIRSDFAKTKKESDQLIDKLENIVVDLRKNKTPEDQRLARIIAALRVSNWLSWVFIIIVSLVLLATAYLFKDYVKDQWAWIEPYAWESEFVIGFILAISGISIARFFHIRPKINDWFVKKLLVPKVSGRFFPEPGELNDDIIKDILKIPHDERKRDRILSTITNESPGNNNNQAF